MGKLRSRTIATILLVVWCSLVCAGDWSPQHRGVGTDSSDPGEIVFFILYVLISEFGKKLDTNYICPVYCAVKHNHIYEIKESNLQTANNIPRPDTPESREQQENGIRACSDVHGLCGNDWKVRETK